MGRPLFLPQYLDPASSYLLFANILLGMLMMVSMHCLLTALRTREKNYFFLGIFFIGALINSIGNLYTSFFVPTIEPYIGSWLMMFSFILFIKHYLTLPQRRLRSVARNTALGICVVLFFVSILHNIIHGRGDSSVIFAMDAVTAIMLISLMGYLLFHSLRGNNRGLSLFIFEMTIVLGGISALGIVKTLVLDLDLFPIEVLQGNLVFITGMVVNGFLFSHLLSRDLEEAKVETARAEARSWELTELDRAKSDFLMNISHELRTPLTVIGGVAKQLRKGKWGDSIKANRRNIEIIERNNARLLKQVNNLLQLAKLEKRRHSLTPVRIDAHRTLHTLAGEFQSIAAQRGLTIAVRVEEGLELTADSGLFHSALVNLVSNAVKFSTPGGVIELGAFSIENEVGVYVSDTGIGIPDDQQPLIFNRFHQAQSDSILVSGGTGIGLSLVQEIMEQHGGRIALDSTVDEGSRFTLCFPLSPALSSGPSIPRAELVSMYTKELEQERALQNGETDRIASDLAGEPAAVRKKSVLLVEDSADLTEYLRAELEPFYLLRISINGREALEQIQESRPDLIISDIMMPKMDGYELLERLQNDEETRHIPVIFLTARNSMEEKIAALQRGLIDYIEKPFSAEVLRAKIDTIVESAIKSHEHYRNRLKTEITHFIDSFSDSSEYVRSNPQSLINFEETCRQLELTKREQDIAELMRLGLSDKEIGARLGLSAKTVSNHNTSLFRKFKVSGRNELVAYGSHPLPETE